MRRDSGFTLIELLMSIVTASIVLGTALMLMTHIQHLGRDLALMSERDEGHKLAPLLSIYWVRHAGANRSLPADATLQITGGRISLEADIDGESGFPDGTLEHPFEDLSIRSNSKSLQLRSGSGRYQPVLPRVVRLEGQRPEPCSLRLELESETRESLRIREASSLTTQWVLYLPNYRSSLFPRSLP